MSESTPAQSRSRMVGGFEVLEKIGVGGMGAVFKARQQSLDRLIALKILPPKLAQNKDFVERFIREARASAALNHPNIVQGIDVGEDKGIYYFAMELIDGETVGQWFKREKPLPESDVLEIARQTCMALAHAHSKNILHRDIKPDNLMVTLVGSRNNSFTVKLMDLGLAHLVEASGSGNAAEEGQAIGTPYYIAPEQARGEVTLTPACDLYALGATMFHLLVGRPPFEGSSGKVIMTRHLTDPAPDAHAINPKVSVTTAKLILRLMSKNAKERPATALELQEEIEHIQKGGGVRATGKGFKGTGLHKPVTNKSLPPIANETQPARKGLPLAPIAAGVLIILSIAAFLIFGKTPPKPVENTAVVKETKTPAPLDKDTEDKKAALNHDAPAVVHSDKPEDDPTLLPDAKLTVSENNKRQERLKGLKELLKEAEEISTQKPDDLDAQKVAWTELKQSGQSTRFMVLAMDKLKLIEDKRLTGAETAARKEIGLAEEDLKGGKFDTALDRLEKIRPYGVSLQTKDAIAALRTKVMAAGQEEGDKALLAADEVQKQSTQAAALDALKKIAAFPYKPIAAEAQKRLDDIAQGQELAKQ